MANEKQENQVVRLRYNKHMAHHDAFMIKFIVYQECKTHIEFAQDPWWIEATREEMPMLMDNDSWI